MKTRNDSNREKQTVQPAHTGHVGHTCSRCRTFVSLESIQCPECGKFLTPSQTYIKWCIVASILSSPFSYAAYTLLAENIAFTFSGIATVGVLVLITLLSPSLFGLAGKGYLKRRSILRT